MIPVPSIKTFIPYSLKEAEFPMRLTLCQKIEQNWFKKTSFDAILRYSVDCWIFAGCNDFVNTIAVL